MQNEEQQLKNRFLELSDRADLRGYMTFSDFLNMEELDVLSKTKLDTQVTPFGGYDSAERRVAGFGECGLENIKEDFPISCIKISPVLQKFSDTLSHRDFLGTLMGIGIKRETLGDIIIHENCGYVFCLKSIQDYILQNLTKVKHTSVKCSQTLELPVETVKLPDKTEIIVASERLDVLISAVYKLSRSDTQKLFLARRIFIGNSLCENTSYTIISGNIVSVRGFGRFIYEGIEHNTKKGRLVVSVRIFK